MKFEWNIQKSAKNLRKHGVSFSEAATVFGDDLAAIIADPDHFTDEDRYIVIGLSNHRRLLLVAYTERDDTIRIISARELTLAEQKAYEETKLD